MPQSRWIGRTEHWIPAVLLLLGGIIEGLLALETRRVDRGVSAVGLLLGSAVAIASAARAGPLTRVQWSWARIAAAAYVAGELIAAAEAPDLTTRIDALLSACMVAFLVWLVHRNRTLGTRPGGSTTGRDPSYRGQ